MIICLMKIKTLVKIKVGNNMKVFKETALLDYNMQESQGGSHCGMIVLKKDK